MNRSEVIIRKDGTFAVPNEDLPTWQHRIVQGKVSIEGKYEMECKYPYLVVGLGELDVAIGYDYFKTELFPIKPLTLDSRDPWRIYTLESEEKIENKKKIDHDIIPVPLSELLGYSEIQGPEVYYMLVKRTESRMPDNLRMSLALITENMPEIAYFPQLQLSDNPLLGEFCPAFVKKDDNIVPVVDLDRLLEDIAPVFCEKYSNLKEYYPYSDDFKFKEQQLPSF